MLKVFPVIFLLLTVGNTRAQQNHVHNGSFEDTISCPANLANVAVNCNQWDCYLGSADYYNVCASGNNAGVPSNVYGYQQAAHGNAYCGLTPYNHYNFEYLGAQITPLLPNAVYEVSMSVNLAEVSNSATNNLGVFFYDSGYSSTPVAPFNTFQSMIPQVHYSNYGTIDDTANWIRLTKYFVADSTYDNILIGGFNDSTNSYIIDTFQGSTFPIWAYYYIDSVVIKLAKPFGIRFTTSPFCAGDTIRVPYFLNNDDAFFKSNNVFTLQLSDSSGSFSKPVNIGTKTSNLSDTIIGVIPPTTIGGSGYRLRMISSNGKDTTFDNYVDIHINAVHFVTIYPTPGDRICNGEKVVFTALPSNSTATPVYQWYVNGQSTGTGNTYTTTILNNQDIVRCDMTEINQCGLPYTDQSNDIQMTVLPWLTPTVSITASPTHPLDQYEYVTFTAVATNAGANPTYQWIRNGQPQQGATSNVWSANTLNDNDSISVEVISNYKCPQPTTAKSNWIKVQLTGVDDIAGFDGLKLYPNPNNGKFVVEAASPDLSQGEEVLLEVVNTLGQVLYTDKIVPANGLVRKEIDLHNIASGVYLLRLKGSDGKTASLRFSVQ